MSRQMAHRGDDYAVAVLPNGRVVYAADLDRMTWRGHLLVGLVIVAVLLGIALLDSFI